MGDASFETSFDTSLDLKMTHLKLSDSPHAPALISDDTPTEAYASAFEPTTPPFDARSPSLIDDEQEDEVEELLDHGLSSLKSPDIKADPILMCIAKQQARPTSQASKGSHDTAGPSGFKARPAPVRQENAGPRMTRSAALRQGLEWTSSSGTRKAAEVPVAAKQREASRTVRPAAPPAYDRLRRLLHQKLRHKAIDRRYYEQEEEQATSHQRRITRRRHC